MNGFILNLIDMFSIPTPSFEYSGLDISSFTEDGHGTVVMEEIYNDTDYTQIVLYDDATIIAPSCSNEIYIEDDLSTLISVYEDVDVRDENKLDIEIVSHTLSEEKFDECMDGKSSDIILPAIEIISKDKDLQHIFLYGKDNELYFRINIHSATREASIIEKVKIIDRTTKSRRMSFLLKGVHDVLDNCNYNSYFRTEIKRNRRA